MVGRGSSLPGFVPPIDMFDLKSVVDIQPGDFSVVIGYKVDEFTHIWSLEFFVAPSHIYPGFTGKGVTPNHFLLEPGCQECSLFDQRVADFEHDIDSFFTELH